LRLGVLTACLATVAITLSVGPVGADTTYKVKKGDTLWEIAKRYKISLTALKRANPKVVPRRMRVGQIIVVPDRQAAKSATASKSAAAKSVDRGQALVNTALGYKGARYRYGGMSSRGFDCSGLVARVLQTHGIRAPHNSAALYKLGKPVTKKSLKPGDLVFFRTRGRGISHVGIYTGNGYFVHASTGRRKVCTDTLRTGYYARRYVGARRLTG
jgi:cell wall-associated NlpC family hydrolase